MALWKKESVSNSLTKKRTYRHVWDVQIKNLRSPENYDQIYI